ncbi:MAG: hypothetical protein ACXW11_10775 [Methylotenera sp.]
MKIASACHIWRALAALSTDMPYVAVRQISSCSRPITGLVSLPVYDCNWPRSEVELPNLSGSFVHLAADYS